MDGIEAPRLKLDGFATRERTTPLRLPFRFGVATMTETTQIVLSVRITLPDGRSSVGFAAECLLPKWFDKDPSLSDADNMEQLRASLSRALALYAAAGFGTAFGLSAALYREQHAQCAAAGLNPLVASYGPALVDRAILDALCRLLGRSFAQAISSNLPAIDGAPLTPDLAGFDLAAFLRSLSARPTIAVRHTVGLVDALTDGSPDHVPVGDGLPETLEEVVRVYGCRYFKIKVGGNIDTDLDRVTAIASVLDAGAGDYRCTLDGNEQYDRVEEFGELWRRMAETPRLARLMRSIMLIEQPIRRAVALDRPVTALAADVPLIIDESDAAIDAFPRALSLGYSGVSSKSCKGFYKSILNAARATQRNGQAGNGGRYFLSAEDLCIWPGLSTQQDLALVSLLGLTHVERNGHHYIDGMSFAAESEQEAFLTAHPDLYHRPAGRPVRLRIDDGTLKIGSLQCPGFGCAIASDAWAPV